jgi:hypothetical protein
MKIVQSGLVLMSLSVALYSCQKNNDTPAPVPPKPVNAMTEKLEACLKFDNNYTDSVSKALTDGVVGAPVFTTDRKGNPNSALYLNGSSKLSFLPVNFKGKEVTMAAWAKFAATGTGLSIIANAMDNNSGGMALFQMNDTYGSAVSTPNTNSTEGATLSMDWHHVAATYDGKDIKVYIDGLLVNTVNHPGSVGDGNKNLVIGAFSNEYWKGSIDELRIYSKVMTAGEVKQLAAL